MTIIKESNAAGSRSMSAEPAVDNGFFIDLQHKMKKKKTLVCLPTNPLMVVAAAAAAAADVLGGVLGSRGGLG